MKTIATLSTKIANLEIDKEELEVKLDSLNSQYAGIKNRRTPEAMAEKKTNRTAAAEIRTKIKNINHELRNLEWELENKKEMTLYTILWSLFALLAIVGIVALTIYKYRLGLFGLTDTHDLVAIINGNNPVMDIELYKNLFWMHYIGTFTLVIGILGSITTSIWYAFTR